MKFTKDEMQMIDDFLDAYMFFKDAYIITREQYFDSMALNMTNRIRSYLDQKERLNRSATKPYWDKWIY